MKYSNEEILRTLEGIYNRENDENINISSDDRTDLVTVIADLKNGETFNEMFKDSIERIFKENTFFNDASMRDEFLDALYNSNKKREEKSEDVPEEVVAENIEKKEELDENSQKLIEEIEQVQSILYTDPKDVENYSTQEQIESQKLDQIKDRIRNDKVEEKDKTFLKSIFNKYIPEYELTDEEKNKRINYCNDLIDNINKEKAEEIEIPEEKKEIDKIIEKIQENEAYQSKFLEENKEEIIKEFIETTQKELEELEDKELTEEEQNKQRILNETLNQLDSENNINNENLKALLKARQYNENNELYLRVIDKQIEELKKQLEDDTKDNILDDTPEDLSSEERLEIKVDDENREDIIKALNEVLDEKEKTATEEERKVIQIQKSNVNNPNNNTNENIESLIKDNDLTQEVLESRINSIDKELDELTEEQNKIQQQEQSEQSQENLQDIYKKFDELTVIENDTNNLLINIEQQKKEIRKKIFSEDNSSIDSNAYLNAKIEEESLIKELEQIEKERQREIDGKGDYKGIKDVNYMNFWAEKQNELDNKDNIRDKKTQNMLERRYKKIADLDALANVKRNRLTELQNIIKDLENSHLQDLEHKYEESIKNLVEKEKIYNKELDKIEQQKEELREKIKNQNSSERNKQTNKEKLAEIEKKIEELRKKKEELEKGLKKSKKPEESEKGKDNTDIQKKIDELKEKRDRIASIPDENKELRTIKDAYNTIKKDAINILSNSDSFKNATDEEKLDAISTGVETHESFTDLNLYKGNKEKLIQELKEDIAKALGLEKERGPKGPEAKPTKKEEKYWLQGIMGAAVGLTLGVTLAGTAATVATFGIPIVTLVTNAIPAVNKISKIYANSKMYKKHLEKEGKETGTVDKIIEKTDKVINNKIFRQWRWFINGTAIGFGAGRFLKNTVNLLKKPPVDPSKQTTTSRIGDKSSKFMNGAQKTGEGISNSFANSTNNVFDTFKPLTKNQIMKDPSILDGLDIDLSGIEGYTSSDASKGVSIIKNLAKHADVVRSGNGKFIRGEKIITKSLDRDYLAWYDLNNPKVIKAINEALKKAAKVTTKGRSL